MKKYLYFIFLSTLFFACSQSSFTPPDQRADITNASKEMRFQAPEGTVEQEKLPESVDITLNNNFPIWRDSIAVIVNVSIKNKTQSHLPARVMGHLFIYSFDEKKPLYWSNLDMAYSEPAGPGLMNILSIPVGSSKDMTIPIAQMTWAPVDQKEWPDNSIYTVVPTGKYLMRFELDFYTEDNQSIGTAVSNFVQFSTIMTAPDVIIPKGTEKK